MTREEARQFGISLLEGIAERNTGKYAENVRLAIAALTEPLLSSNIDEAAEEYAPDFSNSIVSTAAVDAVRDAFKAGVKWMAEQGVTFEDTVINDEYLGYTLADKIWEEATLIGKFEDGDKVIVQIRKK